MTSDEDLSFKLSPLKHNQDTVLSASALSHPVPSRKCHHESCGPAASIAHVTMNLAWRRSIKLAEMNGAPVIGWHPSHDFRILYALAHATS